MAAGRAAGISANFPPPLSGLLFAMEVILREFSLAHLYAIGVASVAGAVVAHTTLGRALTFTIPSYDFDNPGLLSWYALLALVTAAVAWLFLFVLDWRSTRLACREGYSR